MQRADAGARASRLDVVGIWHSHPDHPARPSATDERAAWEGWSYLIAGVGRAGLTDLRSWRLSGREFVEEPLRVVGDGGRS
jgi:proteasome lid subunit RPN8/RPN11